jgi:hypothetical protein
MWRILLLFFLAVLTGIAIGIWGASSVSNLPIVVSVQTPGRMNVATSPAPSAMEMPVIVSKVLTQQDVLDTISRLKLDSDTADFDSIIELLAGQDPAFVAGVFTQIPDHEVCGYLLNRLAIRWAQQKPAETARWLKSLPEGVESTQALISAGRVWAETDPAQAAAYAEQFPPGQLRQHVLAASLSVWINQDVMAAATWVSQSDPSPDLDEVAAEIARTPELINADATAALSWAESITNEEQRRQSIAMVLSAWAERDRSKAIEYAENTPALSSEQRDELMDDLQFNN